MGTICLSVYYLGFSFFFVAGKFRNILGKLFESLTALDTLRFALSPIHFSSIPLPLPFLSRYPNSPCSNPILRCPHRSVNLRPFKPSHNCSSTLLSLQRPLPIQSNPCIPRPSLSSIPRSSILFLSLPNPLNLRFLSRFVAPPRPQPTTRIPSHYLNSSTQQMLLSQLHLHYSSLCGSHSLLPSGLCFCGFLCYLSSTHNSQQNPSMQYLPLVRPYAPYVSFFRGPTNIKQQNIFYSFLF